MIFEPAHVDHQVVIAERRPALGQQDLVVAGRRHLLRRALDIVRRHELALLDVDDAAGAPGRHQQIGLPAKKRRDLQNVRRFGRGLGLRRLVNVGEHRNALAPQPCQDSQPFLQPRPAIRESTLVRLALSKDALKTNWPADRFANRAAP